MYLLYLDDSGSPNNKDEDYFVLGGICVSEEGIRGIQYSLDCLAKQIDAEHPEKVEFHASEIYAGNKEPWKYIPDKKQRIEIIKRVLKTLNGAHVKTHAFSSIVHKKSFPNEDPALLAYEDITSRFDLFLQSKCKESNSKVYGLIIIDKTSLENNFRQLTYSIRENGNRWGNQLRHIAETPLFVDSRVTRLTQLADHVAYATFRRYNAGDLNYYNCIEGQFYEKDGIIHGLSHLHKLQEKCTCPSCLRKGR